MFANVSSRICFRSRYPPSLHISFFFIKGLASKRVDVAIQPSHVDELLPACQRASVISGRAINVVIAAARLARARRLELRGELLPACQRAAGVITWRAINLVFVNNNNNSSSSSSSSKAVTPSVEAVTPSVEASGRRARVEASPRAQADGATPRRPRRTASGAAAGRRHPADVQDRGGQLRIGKDCLVRGGRTPIDAALVR